MRFVLTAEQMRQCDRNTMEHYGVPSAVLMERAALSVADEILERFPDADTTVLIACGTGNNGGDGLALARLLFLADYTVTVFFPGDEQKCSEECARQLGIAEKYGLDIRDEFPEEEYDVMVDAIFGTGLARNVGGAWARYIDDMNDSFAYKVAVDMPSGIHTDTGHVMGIAFEADLTVTFGFAKRGLILCPGAGYAGEIIIKNMGIDEFAFMELLPDVVMPDESEMLMLPERQDDSNKGSYGRLLIFAGSYNMAGAAAFSAMAAYRSGSGLVKVVTEASNREIIQTLVPEAVLATYDEKTDMESFVAEQLDWADAVVLGPGIGQSSQAADMVKYVMAGAQMPCVVDADGINILAAHKEWIGDCEAELVLTPHPGEMARLTDSSVDEVKADLLGCAKAFSDEYSVVTVLKDSRTVVCTPGYFKWLCMAGNDGMATGGSGDVLTGIIGAFLGIGLSAEQSAVLGVMTHGAAGNCAAKAVGRASVTASDIVEGIGAFLKDIYSL